MKWKWVTEIPSISWWQFTFLLFSLIALALYLEMGYFSDSITLYWKWRRDRYLENLCLLYAFYWRTSEYDALLSKFFQVLFCWDTFMIRLNQIPLCSVLGISLIIILCVLYVEIRTLGGSFSGVTLIEDCNFEID